MLTRLILLFFTIGAYYAYPPIIIIPIEDEYNSPLVKQGTLSGPDTIQIGSCKIAINRLCPDPEVTFFLYSKAHPELPESVRIGSDPSVSNLTSTNFNPTRPTKIIIHGYNSDMYLNVLVEVRKQYLHSNDLNVFAVDWSPLAAGPCYPAAVWNARHVGECASQLVERIRELGASDIHVIGFSLGAQVTNFVANTLLPYKLPRITGLDPAMPGFLTASKENKLDKSDAQFVDVLHTNAFIQGVVEETGHVDFYINGGVIQPGCWAENRFFACNHHRAPQYFAESINTPLGFWGWPCPSYAEYLLGRCPPREPQIIMGEHVSRRATGVHLVITESVAPFAVGKYTGPAIEILLKSERNRIYLIRKFKKEIMEFMDEDDLIQSLYKESKNRTRLNTTKLKEFDDYFGSFSGNLDISETILSD